MSDNVVEQLSSIAVLHNHIELFLRLDNLIELDDIGMPHLLQNFNLSSDSFDIFLVMNLIFLKNFNCNFLAR